MSNAMRGCCWVGIVLGLTTCSSGFADDNGARKPDLESLIRAGAKTRDRLQRQAASWTATTKLQNDVRVDVKILSTPDRRRTVLSLTIKDQPFGEFRFVTRDGLWYVSDAGRKMKYRPYEAPFLFTGSYLFLLRGELRYITDETALESLGNYEGTQDGAATFRTKLEEPVRKQLVTTIEQLEMLGKRDPKFAKKPEMPQTIERMRRMLAGMPLRIDDANGVIVQFGAMERQTEVHDFKWLDNVDPKVFDVEGSRWEDFSDDPARGNRNDLVMISHNPNWQPGMKSGDSECCLVDVSTGRHRRIPFQGINALPGCFLKDRQRVIVMGLDDKTVGLRPYEINLSTGANRALGGEEFAYGQSFFPAISPDGKQLAILHKKPDSKGLQMQLHVIDLVSGRARSIGKPRDFGFLSWLPDGKELLVMDRGGGNVADLNQETKQIVRINLQGQVTPVREGRMPVLMNDGKTVLFDAGGDEKWQTCDLDGKNVRPYADGLAHYSFPTVGPDGKRMLWMKFQKGAAPRPTVLSIGENEGKPLTETSGLWSLPAWR